MPDFLTSLYASLISHIEYADRYLFSFTWGRSEEKKQEGQEGMETQSDPGNEFENLEHQITVKLG